jgi:hypothetical protein
VRGVRVSYIFIFILTTLGRASPIKNNQSAMKDCQRVCVLVECVVCIWPRQRERVMIFIMLTVCIPGLMAEEEIKCVNTQAFRKRFIFLLLH